MTGVQSIFSTKQYKLYSNLISYRKNFSYKIKNYKLRSYFLILIILSILFLLHRHTKMSDDSSQISLFADFDSANMARYERISKGSLSYLLQQNQSSSTICASTSNLKNNAMSNSEADMESKPPPVVIPKYDIEFNVWTRQDCEGLPGENGNRYLDRTA